MAFKSAFDWHFAMPNAETKTPLALRRDATKGKIFTHIRQD
jgi:hypothetical protein